MNCTSLTKRLQDQITIFDGAFGTELYRMGFFVNTSYDGLNLQNSKAVESIYQSYVDAGVDVITTNTYNANPLKLATFGLSEQTEKINEAAVALARKAISSAPDRREILLAGAIGPITEKAPQEQCRDALLLQAKALLKAKADFLLFETLSSLTELQNVIAVVAALPDDTAWIPSFVFSENATLADDATLKQILAELDKAPRPAAFGLNCGEGPESTLHAFQKLCKGIPYPAIVQPGAGAPKRVDNRFMPMTTPEYFTTYCRRYTDLGARAVGGCCGIGPAHISELVRSLKPLIRAEKNAMPQVAVTTPQTLKSIPLEQKSTLGKKLHDGQWVRLLELTPPAGFDLTGVIEKARQIKAAGFDAINLPDGPRASSRVSQIITAAEIQEKAGIDTVVHCCARDRNLISLQSMLLGCMAKNLRNILFVTGDPPKLGNYPFSSGVFDVDSIGLLKIASRLNCGIDVGGQPLGSGNIQTAFVSGAGADPNAIDPEREYRRLVQKVEAGAEFIITQPIFEPEVLFRFLERIRPLGCPVIAGVWPFASYRNAQFMKTEVPGVVVPDWIMDAMAKAGDKEAQRLEGIRIARKILTEIRPAIQGIATSAPFGRIDTAIAVCQGF